MLIPVAALAVALTVVLFRGKLTALTQVRIRWSLLLVAALVVQVLIISVVPHWPAALLAAAHLFTYGLAGVFVWLNRRIPGLWLVGLGGGANLAAIAANGGVMPASPAALEVAGFAAEADGFANSAAMTDANLWFLGDIFAIPAGWPLANVFSVGDVLILLGVAVALHRICGSRLVPAAWRWSPPDTDVREDESLTRA